MFDASGIRDAAAVRACTQALAGLGPGLRDAGRVEALRALEELKAAAAAAQAQLAADLDASVRARHAARGLPAARQGAGVAAQVAQARRESPHRGGQHLGVATALVREMPHALAGLRAGWLSEWRATLLVRETACLSRAHRRVVDRVLAANPATLEGVGDAALVARAKELAYRLDPESVLRRTAQAESSRRVSLRPAPDIMARLGALLPVKDGVAVYAALTQAARAALAAGDRRSRGQVMADTLVARVTGRDPAGQAHPVALRLVMTDRALLAGADDPAYLPGYGPVPAEYARRLVRDLLGRAGGAGRAWLRRLFTHPDTGELVGLDAHARIFPAGLSEFIELRDQSCRTPWCDAPIRHSDHARRASDGGATSAANGQGLCVACNQAKEAPGWSARSAPDSRPGHHRIRTTTPTGHSYLSRPPPVAGAA